MLDTLVLARFLCRGVAPLLFGYLSHQLASRTSAGNATGFGSAVSGRGLQETFLIVLVSLLVSGLLMLLVGRPYPRDVATALAAENASREAAGAGG